MKKGLVVLLALLLSLGLLAGCKGDEISLNPAFDEILLSFEEYALTENAQIAYAIAQRFTQEPILTLQALTATEHRGQALLALGSTIADAKRHSPTAYADYAAAIALAESLGLNEEDAQMLGILQANIDHWYTH